MKLCDINPFMRFAGLQPSVLSDTPFSRAYDHRLFYVLDGSGKLIYDDACVEIDTGTLLYFGPNKPYYFVGKIKIIVLNFDLSRARADQKEPMNPLNALNTFNEALLSKDAPPPELSDLIVVKNAFEAEPRLQKCLIHYSYQTPLSDAYTSAIIKELLCYAVQNGNAQKGELPEIVQRIKVYLQQNYDKSVPNSQISNEFGYHSYYLNRVFKKHTGTTIHQALVQEKINVAKTLLRNTSLSVNAVAAEVGFSDRTQFCTAFRKHTKYTPTEYRKNKSAL